MKKFEKYWNNIGIFYFLFFIALTKSVLFSRIGFGLLDEGESLHNAVRILNGLLPYKDFFAIFPPLDNFIFAYIFKIFGKSVFMPRLVMSIFYSFGPPLMFIILSKYTNRFLALLMPLIFVFVDLNVERLYFLTPIFIAILIFESKPFFSGLLLGIVSLIRFDLPGTYLIGLILKLIFFSNKEKKSKVSELISILLGYSIPIVLLALWLFKNGLTGFFIESTFTNSVYITKLHHIPFPSIQTLFTFSLNQTSLLKTFEAFYAYGVLSIYVIFLIYFIRNIFMLNNFNIVIIFFISGILSLPYIFGRSDLGHIVKGSIPVFFLLPFLASKFVNKKFLWLFYSLPLIVLFVFIFESFIWLRFNDTKIKIGNYNLQINSSAPTSSTAVSAGTLTEAQDFLSKEVNSNVLALPYMAGLYFLSDKEPPNKYNNLLAGFVVSVKEQEKFVADIQNKNIKRIVYARELGPKMVKNKLYQYNPLIDDYIMKNFRIFKSTNDGWLLMERI